MLPFPNIDPVIIEIGPLAIRWYSLAYVAGIILGCIYMDRINSKPPAYPQLKISDDFLIWAILGIVLGGRLGYVLFYNLSYYLMDPIAILHVWKGGMSFHGGLLGVIAACYLFAKKHQVPIWYMFDLVSCAAPIGLFFGRIANFINGELYGRTTDVYWAMVFPTGGPHPRHPSQLYQAASEGLMLFVILYVMAYTYNAKKHPGLISGVFLAGYSLARIVIENYREPDAHIDFIWEYVTMGQLLSLPMLLLGCFLIVRAIRNKKHVA